MPTNVQLEGFPPVLKLTFNQPSDSRPGRCIVDTLIVGPYGIRSLPRITSLSVSSDSFSGNWYDLRVVKTPRVMYGRMRTVLEDSRWKLWDKTMTANYNSRNHLGTVMSGSEKTIADLSAELASGTGVTVIAGEVPPYKPPAQWIGRRAGDCLEELLNNTGCRFVYDPTSGAYTIGLAATGFTKPANTRIFRPAPPCNYKTLKVRTAPILYEDKIPCTAKQINTSTGAIEAISDPSLPNTPTEDHGQTKYRLWQPDSVTHPEAHANSEVIYLDKRVKSQVFIPDSPLLENARIVRDLFDRNPYHVGLSPKEPITAKAVVTTAGGTLFLSEHPVLIADGAGSLKQTCEIITSYHLIENGDIKRNVIEIDLGGDFGEKIVDMDWIRPIDSAITDIGADVWGALHSEVATAIASKYKGEVGTVITPNFEDLNGSCHIGAAKYEFRIGKKPRIYYSISLGFKPGSVGSLV